MEKINLIKHLENTKAGTILYSPMYGDVKFSHLWNPGHLDNTAIIFCETLGGTPIAFYSDGTVSNGCSGVTPECMLFPSKENRSWDDTESK